MATERLADVAAQVAGRAAYVYMDKHGLKAEPSALAESLKAMVKLRMGEALHDAKEALDCGMRKMAEMAFVATMIEAGIDAAKEAGFPAGGAQ